MKKKFAIDCSKLNTFEKSGTHRFLVGFLNELTKNKLFDYTFFYNQFNPKLNDFDFIKRGEVVILHSKSLYTQFHLLKEINNFDYFLFPWQTLPFFGLFSKARKISVIHDTGFSLKTKLFTLLTQLTSDQLFSVSKFTAENLIRPSVIISEGVDSEIFHNIVLKDLNSLRKSLDVPDFFILTLGRIEKRKNIYNNLESFSIVQKYFPKLKYVIVGPFIESESDIYSFIDRLQMDRTKVVFKKYISDFELNIYLNCMEFMVFTPKIEGFGLPVLEAYSVQKMVILSKIQALADFGLTAKQYVNPEDPKDIAERVINLLKRNESPKLGKAFKSILDKYSWKNSVSNFINNI
jgi:glycosyltransferase involved in cell wall biosynthesis